MLDDFIFFFRLQFSRIYQAIRLGLLQTKMKTNLLFFYFSMESMSIGSLTPYIRSIFVDLIVSIFIHLVTSSYLCEF